MALTNYSFRAYMNYDVRPSDDWTFNCEYQVDGTIDSGAVEDVANGIKIGLQGMLLDNVIVDRVVASTWVPDGMPYDPSTLRVFPMGVFGLVEFPLGDPVDDDLALFIRKAVSTGRSGKIMLRGTMTTLNITTDSGSWVLTGGAVSAFAARVLAFSNDLLNAPGFALIGAAFTGWTYPATAEGVKQIPIKNYASTPTVREVSELSLVGPIERQDTQ